MLRDYRFVPVTRADFPLIVTWLSHPHIGGWWGPADRELALIDNDLKLDLDQGRTDMRMVWLDGAPFAYVQDRDVHHEGIPQYAHLPAGSRAMDTFLGDPTYLGQGHAPGYLRARAGELIEAGAPCVAVDPDPANLKAVSAYEKAGFSGETITQGEQATPVRVMTFHGGQAPGRTTT